MPRNGAGTYIPTAGQPVVSGTIIDSSVFNAFVADVGQALTQSLAIDGQSVMTAHLPMGANKITNLAAGTQPSDAVRFDQVVTAGDLSGVSGASRIGDASGRNQQQVNDFVDTTVENIADLTVPFQRSCYVRSHHDGSRLGGGRFNWDANKDKALHDGGTVIDPLMLSVLPVDWTNTTQVTAWITNANVGAGCWVRDTSQLPTIFDYGFTPNVLANAASNTILFQKLIDVNKASRVPFYDAPLYVTSGINIKNGRSIVGDNEYMGEPLLADPDRGIIGDGSGALFTTGTYPATANTNRQLNLTRIRGRNANYPVLDLLHSDDMVLDTCAMYTSNAPAVRQLFSARVRYEGGHYATTFTSFAADNFCIRIYDNGNGTWISPTTVIAGGTNGGGVDVTQSQKVDLNGIIESNGGYGIRVGGYGGNDLPLWTTGIPYVRGQMVKNTTNAWVCKLDHTSSALFSTDQATKWQVINGNCNGVSINGYIEATNRPISIGAANLVLGCKLGSSGIYVGNTNSSSPLYVVQLGAVVGLSIEGGVSFHKKGTEPTISFVQPQSGSSIADYLLNSTIENLHIQGGGADYVNGLNNADQIGFVFGRNVIKFGANTPASGQVREFISPTITANVGLVINAFILATGNGGVLDSIEVINATGTLACTLAIGYTVTPTENVSVDPSSLTYSNGAAAVTLASTLIRPSQIQTIRVTAGAGTGSFRVRIRYRM